MRTIKTQYKSNSLPHIQPIGATFFVTFRLHGSLPKSYIQKIKMEKEELISSLKMERPIHFRERIAQVEKRYFKLFDDALDKIHNGIQYLSKDEIAQETVKQLQKYNGEWYDLIAYCIMPNHVHFLIDTRLQLEKFDFDEKMILKNYTPLYTIMQRIKGASARYSNVLLDKQGFPFWQRDYFDYFIRNNKEFQRIITYILENPVKAKLVKNWDDFPYTFLSGV